MPAATVTIILPTRNEGGGIREVILSLDGFGDELLIVDGHSTDRTREIAQELGKKVILDNGRGKGDGLRTGIRHAQGDIIVFMDCDGSHDRADIPKLIQPILEGKADMVVGSRAAGGSDEFQMNFENLIRQVGSHFAACLVNWRWDVSLTDIQNGFRAIRRAAAIDLNLNADDFDIEEEMVMKALKKGYRISEIPSHEHRRKWGVSKLPTSKCWKFLYRLLREILLP